MSARGIRIPGHNGSPIPKMRDPNGLFSSVCTKLAGGAIKPMAPRFVETIANPETDVLQEDNAIPLQEDDGQFFINR